MFKIRQLGFKKIRSVAVFALNNVQEFGGKIKRQPSESTENQARMIKLMHSQRPIPVIATELRIQDMLDDPIVRCLMDRDGVKPQTIVDLTSQQMRERWLADRLDHAA